MKQKFNLTQEQFEAKHTKMLIKGMKANKVFSYPKELFDRLRPFCIGGFPASIMLFINEMCNGKCYDRAMLMQLAFKDATVVHADINSLRCQKDCISPEHAFVETKAFGGNRTWVIDTSIGLIYEKNFYYKIENPKINKVFTKEQCMQNPDIVDILASNFENDKYALPLYLSTIESAVERSNHLGTVMYKNQIKQEIADFKQAINYDGIVKEIDDDIALSRTDPKKLDEKFGIVRDEYGMEISRNGVPNPYYKTAEEFRRENEYFESIKDDPEKLNEFFEGIARDAYNDITAEYERNLAIAQQRLLEIQNNPTANFYDYLSNNNGESEFEAEVCQ